MEKRKFTLQDNSSHPYSWMTENYIAEEVEQMGVENFVRDTAKAMINVFNLPDDTHTDQTVYRQWRQGSEFDNAVSAVKNWIEDSKKTVVLDFDIPAAYKAGEWRLSRKVYGPRGGVSWVRVFSTPATGTKLINVQLKTGEYQVTYWSNNWPHSYLIHV